ncbi:primosomal protein N' [Nocardia takedensis]|uniref:primosomal protein N' family DNA-binding protein n=1 Tax=Nocardia takedensis TaxID=259390 RepID=UPI00030B9454|nr:primosomal protein N' [Nocardia takedensis]
MLPLLSPAHLDRDFDYVVPPELDDIARPGVRVRVRFAGRLVDGYLLERLEHTEHTGKMVNLERVVSAERVLTPEILTLATAVAHRYAGTRADVLRLAIPPRHARTENGVKPSKSPRGDADSEEPAADAGEKPPGDGESVADVEGAGTDEGTVTAEGSPAAMVSRVDAPGGAEPPTAAESEAGGVDAEPSAASSRVADAEPSRVTDRSDYADRSAEPGTTSEVAGSAVVTQAGSAGEMSHTGKARSAEPLQPTANQGGRATDFAGSAPGAGDARGEEDADSAGARGRGSVRESGVGGVAEGGSGEAEGFESACAEISAVRRGDGEIAPGAAGGEVRAPSRTVRAMRAVPEVGPPSEGAFDPRPWERYTHGGAFLTALGEGKGVRAAWQALPGEDWARRLAELAAAVVATGRSAILLVPDQRDLDRVLAECVRLVGDSAVGLAAGLGPAARYRRWLAVLRGSARVVVGTRAAVFAPAVDLGLIVIWDDGDDTYAEPRAPYPHAREVAMMRAHEGGTAFVAAGFARTAEIQAVVESGWAHDLVADRHQVRHSSPRISAPGDSDIALERDPIAKAIRIPGVAFAAARAALKEGAPVLVQVPRRGYVPALACAKCRTPARCRRCNGPLTLPESRSRQDDPQAARSPACRWCGITEAAFRCPTCASRALRAVVIGAARTAEELGRAFPGVPVRGSSGGALLDSVEPGPQVVVATVGAEPTVRGGYGVALLLDSWALLGRADLRAAEDALRRWFGAATLVRAHGQVIVMAEPSIPTVQALLRWDPVGHARAELEARAEVGFPPAVRMAAIDGATEAIDDLLTLADLPANAQVLGPVPLPPFARKPFTGDSPAEVERMILRVDRRHGAALARALTTAQALRSTQRSDAPVRVQIDPADIG